ncbi:hypothetical protein KP509_24G034400 [Ceratopteris richardii]|uniref:Rhodanese domain-containing protein n=1 Tax=Ceratopteris richardii TaxID=49495 RepID=A0A8T2RUE6_CERRI|nr:hypothetical protein KP509_24G034400 [Ceratopteris richardii]
MACQLVSRASALCFSSRFGYFLWIILAISILIRLLSSPHSGVNNVSVEEAAQLLKKGYKYLDVRTFEEFVDGHVEGAINIPFMFRKGQGMTKNVHFIEEVSKYINKEDKVVVGCEVGMRSRMASRSLVAEGFTEVKCMGGGFQAWIDRGQKISTD